MFDFDEIEEFVNERGADSWTETCRCSLVTASNSEISILPTLEFHDTCSLRKNISQDVPGQLSEPPIEVRKADPSILSIVVVTVTGDQVISIEIDSGWTALDAKMVLHRMLPNADVSSMVLKRDVHTLENTDLLWGSHETKAITVCTETGAEHAWLLQSQSPIVQRRAAESLGKIGAAARLHIARLHECIADSKGNDGARAAAAEALGQIGITIPHDMDILAQALEDPGVPQVVRQASARALGSLGPVAIPLLVHRLSDPDTCTRTFAATALGSNGAAAFPYMERLLSNEDPNVRQAALRSLGLMQLEMPSAMHKPVTDCLQDAHENVASAALDACLACGESRLLATSLSAPGITISRKRLAYQALISLGARAAPAMVLLLWASNWYARYKAASYFAQLDGAAFVLSKKELDRITQLACDPHQLVSTEAKLFLVKWGYVRWQPPPSTDTPRFSGSENDIGKPRTGYQEDEHQAAKEIEAQLRSMGLRLHNSLQQPLTKRKKLIKALLVEFHPDKNKEHYAKDVFQYLNNAREWFLNEAP